MLRSGKGILAKLFDIFNYLLFILLCVITLYPFINALAYSFSDGVQASIKNVTVWPVGFTLDNYKLVFTNQTILSSLYISIFRTALGILVHLLVVGMAAYALSKKDIVFRRFWLVFFLIPVYINGGLMPYFVLVNKLGLVNNFLVYIIPPAFNTFEMLVMKTFFESLPDSLEESAILDGAGTFTVFIKIVIPISAPIIATIVLFHGVWQWNSWFDSMLFVTKTDLQPLQMLLQRILLENQATALKKASRLGRSSNVTPEAIKMTTLMVSTIPILYIYPFLQRYFVKGIMIGAVKG